jgi:hypothetical protein
LRKTTKIQKQEKVPGSRNSRVDLRFYLNTCTPYAPVKHPQLNLKLIADAQNAKSFKP